jgi:hypothetical protein
MAKKKIRGIPKFTCEVLCFSLQTSEFCDKFQIVQKSAFVISFKLFKSLLLRKEMPGPSNNGISRHLDVQNVHGIGDWKL